MVVAGVAVLFGLTPEPLYQVKYKPGIPRNRTKGNALRAYTIPENPCSYCYINPETVTGAECTLASQLVPVFEPLEVVTPLHYVAVNDVSALGLIESHCWE